MKLNKKIQIYIDNTGFEEDEKLGNYIKDRLRALKIDVDLHVQTFSDLEKSNMDPNCENETRSAIEKADIVIPILSTRYFVYFTPRIEEAIYEIIASSNRYLFPIILDETDWSNIDWVVKSTLTPRDSRPLSKKSLLERERILNDLVSMIKAALLSISGAINQNLLTEKKNLVIGEDQVFVSHDHDDADFAELLKLRLEKEGITCWLDTERLKVGQDWREEIDRGIENSAAVIAIMTPEAKMSEYVTYEWAFAWGKGKHIFPIMLKQTQLHPRLESLQYLNFTNHPTRPWNDLIDSLKKVIEEK